MPLIWGSLPLRFYTGGASGAVSEEEDNVRYTFDYNFDTKITINDAKKIIWRSFFGKCIQSQGKIKPVWDGAQEHDGAGSLQTKAVVHAFDKDDNVVPGTFSWQRLEAPNVIIVNFAE